MKTLEERLEDKKTSWKELPWYKKTFHPNRISAYSVALTSIGVYLSRNPSTDLLGLSAISCGYTMDTLDGYLSRKWDMQTIEGAKLDPAVDKYRNFIIGGTIISSEMSNDNYILPLAIMCNFAVDTASQIHRWKVSKTKPYEVLKETYEAIFNPKKCRIDEEENSRVRANDYGKYKVWFQAIPSLMYFGMEALKNRGFDLPNYVDNNFEGFLGISLSVAAGLGLTGLIKRNNNKNYIIPVLDSSKA